MKKMKQGNTLNMPVNSFGSDDYRRSSLQANQVVDAIALGITFTNVDIVVSQTWASILNLIDVRVIKDASKVLFDCTALDLALMEKIDTNQLVDLGDIATGATATKHIIIPFHSPATKRPEDTSLVVKSCQSLMIEINNRANTSAGAGTVRTGATQVDTMILYEDIGKGLPVNSERYVRRQAAVYAGAVANDIKSLNPYCYTKLIIGDLTNLANITRLEIFGNNDILFNGEPDELNAMGQYIQKLDFHTEQLIAPTVALDSVFLIMPLLLNTGDGVQKASEQSLQIGFTTSGALTAYILTDSVSFPSDRRVKRDADTVYGSMPKSMLKVGYVAQDGKTTYDGIKDSKANIPSVKITPITEQGGQTANNKNSKVLINSIAKTMINTVDEMV